jgi:hypothetical protein
LQNGFSLNAKIDLDIGTKVAGNRYSVSSGGFVTFTGDFTLAGTAACASCSGQASVALIGSQTEAAATLYTITNPNATNSITGANGNAVNGAAILVR